MRMLLLLTLSFGFAFLASAKEDKKDLVREVELKEPKLEVKKGAKVGEPVKITSKDELAKAVEDKDTAEALGKAVDFSKEYLLIFTWSGSGGDRLTAAVEKEEVVFTLKRGLTKDFRQHAHVFAVAKDAKWSLAK